MKVKICGITNLSDALCACEAGADYLGLVFYPKSPRHVSFPHAARLVQQIQQAGWKQNAGPALVGLFVEASVTTLNRAVAETGVDLLQLYGDYRARDLESLDTPYFVAIRPSNAERAQVESERHVNKSADPGPALLVDAHVPGVWGGTGQTGDWTLAAQVCKAHPGTLLAGGLTPHNVAAAVQQVQPWGVDVSGGVEASKGVKNHDAVRSFVAHAKQAASVSF